MSTYESPADDAAPTGRGPRTAYLIAGALALVLIGGAVALGLRFLGGGGTQPAAVVPDDAIAYVGIDLDPPAGQKIEAYRFLRAFPDLRERAPEDQEDLRQFLIQLALDEAPECDLTWAEDFEPWLGDRAALVLRPGEDEPEVLGTVQVTDEQGARETAAALDACSSDTVGEPTGIAFSDGYAILAETQAIADGAVAAAGQGSLGDLAEFDDITALSGQDGIVEAWFGNGAIAEFLELAGSDLPEGEQDFFTDLYDGDLSGAFTLRFAEAGLEAVAAYRSDQPSTGAPAATIRLGDLPADTAVAFTAGVSEDYEQFLTEQLDTFGEFTGDPRLVETFERESGLSLPEDLLTLVGEEFGLAVREDIVADFRDLAVPFSEGSQQAPASPGQLSPSLPIALVTSSEEAEVSAVLERIRPLIAPVELTTAAGGLGTAYGPDAEWNAAVADPEQRLGDSEAFQAVLPDLDGAEGALFVDFDGRLFEDIREFLGGREAREFDDIVGPLSGLGISISTEGDTQVARIRLGTD